jgi:ubiquitin carboxyl-terminal hydrolase 14
MPKKVTLKHGSKKHKGFVIEDDESFEDFQAKVFSVTFVPLERQKLICKGKNITDDASLSDVKSKSTIMLIGTAESTAMVTDSAAKFIEDMTESDMHKAGAVLPVGLHNLGNTCYLNASLQAMKGVTPLTDALKVHGISSTTPSISSSLGQLFTEMDSVSESVVPRDFVNLFRGTFPRFAEQSERGGFAQQDADECLTEIVSSLRADLVSVDPSGSRKDTISELFGGEFTTETTLDPELESEAHAAALEAPQQNFEEFIKLRCFMDASTRHIRDGVQKDCVQKFEKTSELLGRSAHYARQRKISKLPEFLMVQIVRFFWKASAQKNAKILRAVEFPHEWDVQEFCGEVLKKKIDRYREIVEERDEKRREVKHAVTDASVVSEATASATETTSTVGDDVEMGDGTSSTAVTDASAESDEKKMEVDSDIADGDLETGMYELVGLVTHKGLSANSGHYIGYAKHKQGWVKFDDDVVSPATADDITKLYGGGQWQMGYICFYRKKEVDL